MKIKLELLGLDDERELIEKEIQNYEIHNTINLYVNDNLVEIYPVDRLYKMVIEIGKEKK